MCQVAARAIFKWYKRFDWRRVDTFIIVPPLSVGMGRGSFDDLPEGQLELYCSKCKERTVFIRRKGVALGTGASRRRCGDCGHLR